MRLLELCIFLNPQDAALLPDPRSEPAHAGCLEYTVNRVPIAPLPLPPLGTTQSCQTRFGTSS